MQETRTYANPPIVELVIGAQFAPLDKMTAGHFGALWDGVGRSEWVTPSDAQEIEPQYETFESLPWAPLSMQLKLTPVRGPGRLLLANTANDRLLQIQRTRFHMNWRKGNNQYPSYKKLIAEFLETFDRFVLAVNGLGLGEVRLDQWEITYIDAFPKGEYWETPTDWPKVLPGLFGQFFPTDGTGLELERRAAEWAFEIAPKVGRLYVAAHTGKASDDGPESLMLNMTARGPLQASDGSAGLTAGLARGHQMAVDAFERSASPDARARWEKP